MNRKTHLKWLECTDRGYRRDFREEHGAALLPSFQEISPKQEQKLAPKARKPNDDASLPRFNSGTGKFRHDPAKATVLRPQASHQPVLADRPLE